MSSSSGGVSISADKSPDVGTWAVLPSLPVSQSMAGDSLTSAHPPLAILLPWRHFYFEVPKVLLWGVVLLCLYSTVDVLRRLYVHARSASINQCSPGHAGAMSHGLACKPLQFTYRIYGYALCPGAQVSACTSELAKLQGLPTLESYSMPN